ncbi:ABC transporter permease [Pectobacterium zantedeschiae]|uniref:ATP-binding cassette domain-containing protein n=1 Tax=Pectobacterium zantedeschiae TaxID=2034769 RepID=A0A9X8P614_9GAMM|nr:ABC transporter permease [Pectobacterium zantedeschiae]RYC38409.1 macrolide ABC transporter permease/ATP-binding protein MacB [Pectobacterium zantedeschiae]RYC45054.1 ATP-binding cassette domain-containing protein [Pectobacterium zantedeschiae]RYC47927.1 macrolide ABC transporter permease/ATP-binding protein MacB [Pectobacterium zantedeschiae]
MVNHPPLISLSGVGKQYGDDARGYVSVLQDINLTINAGEFVALIGPSGSGKSTLMHILGALDRATQGVYRFAGQDISQLSTDQLSQLRRTVFGFVFQRYFLIPGISAQENVELPAVYSGLEKRLRHEHAQTLLEQLSLFDRLAYKPEQLSGGQQQRVSIARALINGGEVLLADEPTGALDSANGESVLALLETLAASGRTVILVTHNPDVANRARRVIELRDGRIVSDTVRAVSSPAVATRTYQPVTERGKTDRYTLLGQAWRTLLFSPLRSALTLLGIAIGIASILVMLGIGEGARQEMSKTLSRLGSTLMTVIPQSIDADMVAGRITDSDIEALKRLPDVDAVVPMLTGQATVRQGAFNLKSSVIATTTEAMSVNNWGLRAGTFIMPLHEYANMSVTVLGSEVAQRIFPAGNVVGRDILLNNIPFTVVGILAEQGGADMNGNLDQAVIVPFGAGRLRVIGRQNIDSVTLKARSLQTVRSVEREVNDLLTARHQRPDFTIINRAAILRSQEESMDIMTAMLGSIAAISLLVGGIGVMNVMLMSVAERTREIGIRLAVGARQQDIQFQFLWEAVILALSGGVVGLLAGCFLAQIVHTFGKPVQLGFFPALFSFFSAIATGLLFGYLPARKAARLDPVMALNQE